LPEGTRPSDLDIQLVLTIGVDGTVAAVSLTRGVGEPWDAAALAAAKRFRFNPATSDGKPIAVTVPFTYSFRKPARRGRILPIPEARRDIEPAPGFIYAGEVVEKGSRTPQAGVPVLVRDKRTGKTWEALTDESGRFVVYGLPKGALSLDIFTTGFEPLETPIKVSARTEEEARKEPARVYLAPSGLGAYRTVVKEDRPPRAASEIELTEDELTQVAGTFGDPTRVVASLPGVARSPFGLGYYVVRGAQFDNTGFFIDGHPAIFLYHLLGGPGVVHPELVGGLSFYPGGYPAQYGRVASGAIAVETKDPPRDRWHLDLEVDIFKAGAVFSVPFDDKKGVATIALRRSYYDLILPLIDDSIDLSYTDYQARVSYDFTPRLRGRFVALGAVDAVSVQDVETADGAGSSSTDLGLGFHRLNMAIEADLSKTLQFRSSAFWEYDYIENRRVAAGDAPIDATTDGWIAQLLTSVRWRPEKGYLVEGGIDLAYTDYRANLSIPAAPPLGDPRTPAFDPVIVTTKIKAPYLGIAPYLAADLEVAEGLRLLPGVRLNLDDYADRIVPTIDPKLAIRWAVNPDWTLKGMAAMAHQPPQVFQVGEPFGDPSIPPVEGIQGSLGFEWKPASDWLVSVEGFVQYLDQLVRPSNRIAQNDEGGIGRLYWDADLEGRAYGLEVLIRKEFGDWIYGWLSYTLSRAERLRPPKDWSLFELDQTHVLNLAWTVRLGNEWSLGARFQLASGNPYYDIIDSRYDGDTGEYVPIYANRAGRLPFYHRLDLRLDKTWRFEDWMFELFFDIQNVYNAQNPESPRYSYDFRVRTDGISLPILPSFGFRMVF
jgi:TonB family protein